MSMLDIDEKVPTYRQSEDMFLAWLFGLPDNTNVAEAARSEIARIDSTAPCEQTARLRTMLVQATFHQPTMSRSRRRRHH